MNINTLKTGDLIVREKGLFSTHYIVWIGWHNGVQLVAENHNTLGVRYTSLNEALAGNTIKRFEKFGGTEDHVQGLPPGRVEPRFGRCGWHACNRAIRTPE